MHSIEESKSIILKQFDHIMDTYTIPLALGGIPVGAGIIGRAVGSSILAGGFGIAGAAVSAVAAVAATAIYSKKKDSSNANVIKDTSEVYDAEGEKIKEYDKYKLTQKVGAPVRKELSIEDIPDDLLDNKQQQFYQKIVEYCDQRGMTDVELYKKACISKAVFSNIRSMGISKKTYTPKKPTVICLCIALELSLAQAEELMNMVGFSFSNTDKLDKLVAWCLTHTEFKLNVITINEIFYEKTGESPLIKAS